MESPGAVADSGRTRNLVGRAAKNPPYEPPDQVELLAQELSQEKLARKQLEELNKTLGNELSDIKLSLLSLKGDYAE